VHCPLPALVSVTAGVVEPRYPSFKGHHGGQEQAARATHARDLGIDAASVGWAGAGQEITEIAPVPARAAGEKFEDDGTAHEKIVAFLESLKVI
jgi:electron transfer flavoprotein beta subunit